MAQTPPPALQYGSRSADGRWWWDGQAWQPVPAAPGPGGVPDGPLGKPRSIGVSILLAIVTLGIYTFVWVYKTQGEIKRHSGVGIGGGLGLLIYFFIAPATYFLVASDVASMYERRGWQSQVSALTGLWILLPIAGNIVWFVKVQGALNRYWQSLGASPP